MKQNYSVSLLFYLWQACQVLRHCADVSRMLRCMTKRLHERSTPPTACDKNGLQASNAHTKSGEQSIHPTFNFSFPGIASSENVRLRSGRDCVPIKKLSPIM